MDSPGAGLLRQHFRKKYNDNYSEAAFRKKFGVSVSAVADIRQKYSAVLPTDAGPLLDTLAYYHSYPDDISQLALNLGTNARSLRFNAEAVLELFADHVNEITWDSNMHYPVASRGILAGVAFATDATLGIWPKYPIGHPKYERLFSPKHEHHGKKAISATPLLGGCFSYWPRSLSDGVDADVTLYRDHIRPLVHGKLIKFYDEADEVVERLRILGIADKGFEGEDTLLSPHKGRGLTELQSIFNHYLNCPRAKVENSYGRLKNNFTFWRKVYRTGWDEERYDNASWLSAQMTEVDAYYHPIRRDVLSEMEQFI